MKRILVSLLVLLASCEKEVRLPGLEIPKDKYFSTEVVPYPYAHFYGKWKAISVTGGFAGINKKPDFDLLVVQKFGIYAIIKDEKVIEYGKITAKVFDVKSDLFQVEFTPDSTFSTGHLASLPNRYVELAKPNKLNLLSSCCDGFDYHFERVK